LVPDNTAGRIISRQQKSNTLMNIPAALVKGEKVDLNYRLGYSNEKKAPHQQEEIR
jgi:hypothetical protein